MASPLISAIDLYETLLESPPFVCSTGSAGLDRLLDGGLLAGEVTEYVGPSVVGKTQLCLTATAAAATTTDSSIGARRILYLDSDGSFSAERLLQFVTSRTATVNSGGPIALLGRVAYRPIFEIQSLIATLEGIIAELKAVADGLQSSQSGETLKVGLLVVRLVLTYLSTVADCLRPCSTTHIQQISIRRGSLIVNFIRGVDG